MVEQGPVQDKWRPLSEHLSGAGKLPPKSGAYIVERLYNRDLSWLLFNERVASESEAKEVPLMDRLRFAAIVSSNLDEFFMVRVAEISRVAARSGKFLYPDGMNARQLLSVIREQYLIQKERQARSVKELLPLLSKAGVEIVADFEGRREYDAAIKARVLDAPVVVRSSTEALPELGGQRIFVFVRFPREYAIVEVGRRESRLVELSSEDKVHRFALADRWIASRARELFPKREVLEAFPFKILRDAELNYRLDAEESLERQIVEGLLNRPRAAKIIRLEVDAPTYSEGAIFLATQMGLDSAALYQSDIPLDLRSLTAVYPLGPDRLRYPPVKPVTPTFLKTKDLFAVMRKGDILLHHPYDSFDTVVQFIKAAAEDPEVREIYHSLYRTSEDSPVIESLIRAAKNGKKVTAYVEIRARFDELANVQLAEKLRAEGVRVVRPMGSYKVHSKITHVVRREGDADRTYTHLGTGNYHPGTARQYTDLGLLTADKTIGAEIGRYFQSISKREKPKDHLELLVAPGNLHEKFLALIVEETRIHKAGGRGRIMAKMNSLVDPDIIEALYAASQAGVKIDLMVRGICCLRPGIGGLSDNVRVVSVIDRFLEHSRIYYFRGGGGPNQKMYLSSADWMPRNFYTRYEIAFPVKDPSLRRFIREVVLKTGLADNQKASVLAPDGTYQRVQPKEGEAPLRSQELFQGLAKDSYRGTALEPRFADPAAAAKPKN